MSKSKAELLEELTREFARRGGRARAQKYDHATLVRWAKKGGRPPRTKGKATKHA